MVWCQYYEQHNAEMAANWASKCSAIETLLFTMTLWIRIVITNHRILR